LSQEEINYFSKKGKKSHHHGFAAENHKSDFIAGEKEELSKNTRR
jgi:hypothetical protein